MKIKKVLWSIVRIFLLVICGTILGVNVYSLNANRVVNNKLPMPFGYGAAVVLSGSMEPEFFKNDLIIVKEAEEYELRDIVVYQDGAMLVVHRIIRIDGEMVTTQGDANDGADEPIEVSLIKGKVVFCVPYVGVIIDFLKTPIGTFIIIALAILLVEIPRRREKRSDDEERTKIIEEIKKLKEEQQS